MDEFSKSSELLLREYAETGLVSRQHEQLTRTSASVFIPTLLAIAGFVLHIANDSFSKVVAALAGVSVSLVAAHITRRHQLYYRHYIGRARDIEAALRKKNGGDQTVMLLYTTAKSVKENARLPISSKFAFIIFFLLSAFLFLFMALHFWCSAG